MFWIEKMSNNVASKIASMQKMDKKQEQIIAYGAFNMFQMIWGIVLVVVFGIIFDVLIEALIISFTISFLRKYSGGVHASSPNICAIIGAATASGFALIINGIGDYFHIKLVVLIGVVCFVFSYYIIYKLAPVDSPAKPIKKVETRKRLKKNSVLVLHFLLAINIILLNIYWKFGSRYLLTSVLCICFGAVWQCFTLTNIGHLIMNKIDFFIRKIIFKFNIFGGEKNEK